MNTNEVLLPFLDPMYLWEIVMILLWQYQLNNYEKWRGRWGRKSRKIIHFITWWRKKVFTKVEIVMLTFKTTDLHGLVLENIKKSKSWVPYCFFITVQVSLIFKETIVCYSLQTEYAFDTYTQREYRFFYILMTSMRALQIILQSSVSWCADYFHTSGLVL